MNPLSYQAKEPLLPGVRVVVSVKNRRLIGLVVNVQAGCRPELRPIEEILDKIPIVPEELLNFLNWVSSYYLVPLGKVMKTALPPGFLKETRKGRLPKIDLSEMDGFEGEGPIISHRTRNLQKLGLEAGSGFKVNIWAESHPEKRRELLCQAAALALQRGLTTLILVPEIVDLETIKEPLERVFGPCLLVYSSLFSAKRRQETWVKALSPRPKVILGTRSAVFLPLPNLGLVIVEKEYSSSHRQEEGLRYQARDLALMRAKQAGAKVLLVGRLVSVKSYYLASQKRYSWLSPLKKQRERRLEVVDLSGQRGYFSPRLLNALKMTLARGQKALLFLNRLGFSPILACEECGHIWECPNCQWSLTYHRDQGVLLCHWCRYTQPAPPICPNCGTEGLKFLGAGTERIEDLLRRLFPEAKVLRIDSETLKGKRDLIKLKKEAHQAQILVGTRLIKRLGRIEDLGLIGIILLDLGLKFPHFLAAERTLEILIELLELLPPKQGRLIIQTRNPGHYLLKALSSGDYQSFYREELKRRAALSFPPFSRLALLEFRGKGEKEVEEAVFLAREILEDEVETLGPVKAPLYHVKGFYRWHLLVKAKNFALLQRALQGFKGVSDRLPKRVQLMIEIDPEEMF